MKIEDIIETRNLTYPAHLGRFHYKEYNLVPDEDGNILIVLGENDPYERFCITTNKIFIDALNFGKQLADISYQRLCLKERPNTVSSKVWSFYVARPWYCADQIQLLKKWIDTYGFIPLYDIEPPDRNYLMNLSMELMTLYETFCKYLKGMYGDDTFQCHSVSLLSQDDCRDRFYQTARKSYIFRFDGKGVQMKYQPFSLVDLLNDMMFDLISTFDEEYKPFICRICQKPGFKRNPKQCYCAECSRRRYQVSRNRKKQGGKPHGKA